MRNTFHDKNVGEDEIGEIRSHSFLPFFASVKDESHDSNDVDDVELSRHVVEGESTEAINSPFLTFRQIDESLQLVESQGVES